MAKIERVELRLVDIPPKVVRTDAIQSFVSQETPIVSITDSDGAVGTGYSYTIGTGGSSIMRLLADHLVPRLIARMRNGSRRSGATSNSPPTRQPSARSRRSRSPRSTPPSGTFAASVAACRCGSPRAARPIAGRSTRPRAAGCTSTSRRWSTTRSPPGSKASQARKSRSAGRARRRTIAASRRCARRSAPTTRS